MEIIPDPIHVALLTLPFLVTVVGLHLILWRPLLAYLDERDAVSARARHEAHELEGAASEQMTRIEARLADARSRIGGLRQEARQRALAAEAEIVAAARRDAEQRTAAALATITAEKNAASGALGATADELGRDIATRVLGRDPGASTSAGLR